MYEAPELSVIIVSYNAIDTIQHCLDSLERQTTSRGFETIVVDSSTDGTGELVKKKFPRVKLYRFSERKFPGDARNIGISLAKTKILAFLDADCQAESNWIEEIVKAHNFPHQVIGGAIANGNPESYVGWAAYFCEFSQWMPGTKPQWMTDIPGANISYKKEIFETHGGFIEGTYCSDTDFHWRIGDHGHSLLFHPSILVSHINISSLERFLRHEYFHGRSFARVRVGSRGLSGWRRAAYVTFLPLVLAKLLLERSRSVFRSSIYLPQFLKVSPLLAVGVFCWSLGEAVGYAGKRTWWKRRDQ